MIKITVITVTYNAVSTIEDTILSVISQNYSDIDYVIVDGASEDGTVTIIRDYAERDRRIRYVSEPDNGLYDAMNKGARMAEGDYIYFLNSGDLFHDNKVISDIVGSLKPEVDIIYGNIVYMNPDGSRSVRKYSQFCSGLFYYLLGDCINHQAMFASKRCFSENAFDTFYRISADREWMIRQKKAGMKYKAVDRLICCYSLDEESISVRNEKLTWKENGMIIKKHLPAGYPLYCFVNLIRNGSVSSKILHELYEIAFIRNTGE
ncbi:MAG: glycosyltransferase [Lachnospiraceae bacterium]|jgi:glycosyltransferase involved in cell wall biosynthesis|nr:glycosyltransferase [Lachnospiraceae bacterium]